jgi:hypothetical protein
MKKTQCSIRAEIVKAVVVQFPLYLRYGDEDSDEFDGWYTEYWKVESVNKITIIKESSNEIAIITHNDNEVDYFYELVTEEMFKCENGWEHIQEKIYDSAFNRLVDKISNS